MNFKIGLFSYNNGKTVQFYINITYKVESNHQLIYPDAVEDIPPAEINHAGSPPLRG
jgi:hypothetical protein